MEVEVGNGEQEMKFRSSFSLHSHPAPTLAKKDNPWGCKFTDLCSETDQILSSLVLIFQHKHSVIFSQESTLAQETSACDIQRACPCRRKDVDRTDTLNQAGYLPYSHFTEPSGASNGQDQYRRETSISTCSPYQAMAVWSEMNWIPPKDGILTPHILFGNKVYRYCQVKPGSLSWD